MFAWLMHPAVLVGVGGALGSNARYWLGRWFQLQPWAKDFYWGTFCINVTGSILLGLIAALFKDRAGTGFLLLGTGFCGGYTTFSSFSLQTLNLMNDGEWLYAAGNVVASVGLCLFFVWLGAICAAGVNQLKGV